MVDSETPHRRLCVGLEKSIAYPDAEGEGGSLTAFRSVEASWDDEYISFFGTNLKNADVITVRRDNVRSIVYVPEPEEENDE